MSNEDGPMGAIRDCFVIMPFSDTASRSEVGWTEIYEHVFKPAVEGAGLTCERVVGPTGQITSGIIEKLRTCYLVMADVTDHNGNVCYELGVRHSLSRRTIIVAHGNKHALSDLGNYKYTVYGTQPGQVHEFKQQMRRLVENIEKSPEHSDNPVSDYLEKEQVDASRYRNRENLKKLSALTTELNGNILELRSASAANGVPAFARVRTNCLDYLLTVYYLDPGPEFLKLAFEVREALDRIRGMATELPVRDVSLILHDLKLLASRIKELRDTIERGGNVEPARISLMCWSPRHDVEPARSSLEPLGQGDCSDSGIAGGPIVLSGMPGIGKSIGALAEAPLPRLSALESRSCCLDGREEACQIHLPNLEDQKRKSETDPQRDKPSPGSSVRS
jgi:hypothetical protein